jgi:SNF2 family DNA or RNA helicase
VPDGPEGPEEKDNAFLEQKKMQEWMNDRNGTAGKKSPKLEEAVRIIKATPPGDKVLMFSSFVCALDLMKERLKDEEILCVTINGSMGAPERKRVLEQFHSDQAIKVLLMTIKVGAFGYNITAANHVIFLDLWWNQVTHTQALHRVNRLGQTKEMEVHYIIAKKQKPWKWQAPDLNDVVPMQMDDDDDDLKVDLFETIEGHIRRLCQSKKEMSNQVFASSMRKDVLKKQ